MTEPLFDFEKNYNFSGGFRNAPDRTSPLYENILHGYQNHHGVPTAVLNKIKALKEIAQLTDQKGRPLFDPKDFSFIGVRLPKDKEAAKKIGRSSHKRGGHHPKFRAVLESQEWFGQYDRLWEGAKIDAKNEPPEKRRPFLLQQAREIAKEVRALTVAMRDLHIDQYDANGKLVRKAIDLNGPDPLKGITVDDLKKTTAYKLAFEHGVWLDSSHAQYGVRKGAKANADAAIERAQTLDKAYKSLSNGQSLSENELKKFSSNKTFKYAGSNLLKILKQAKIDPNSAIGKAAKAFATVGLLSSAFALIETAQKSIAYANEGDDIGAEGVWAGFWAENAMLLPQLVGAGVLSYASDLPYLDSLSFLGEKFNSGGQTGYILTALQNRVAKGEPIPDLYVEPLKLRYGLQDLEGDALHQELVSRLMTDGLRRDFSKKTSADEAPLPNVVPMAPPASPPGIQLLPDHELFSPKDLQPETLSPLKMDFLLPNLLPSNQDHPPETKQKPLELSGLSKVSPIGSDILPSKNGKTIELAQGLPSVLGTRKQPARTELEKPPMQTPKLSFLPRSGKDQNTPPARPPASSVLLSPQAAGFARPPVGMAPFGHKAGYVPGQQRSSSKVVINVSAAEPRVASYVGKEDSGLGKRTLEALSNGYHDADSVA